MRLFSNNSFLSIGMACGLAITSFTGCAHKTVSTEPKETPTTGDRVVLPFNTPKEVNGFRVTDADDNLAASADQELETIPTDYNDKVEKWLNYFQGKGRPHMERYLSRSTRYMKLMKKILRDNGLPEDLVYIALIESGFSPKATSHAAAVGYWQFIRSTGRRYGLEANRFMDERRDPILSTQAAAEYFKGLYSVFGSWYLAMASYNVGENRVKREVMNHYTRDFWVLARKRRFPRETINYIPKFIAAKMIGRDPKKYGFNEIDYEKPLEFELIRVNGAVNLRQLATKMNFDFDDLKSMNPKFKGEIAVPRETNENQTLELRVPIGQTAVAMTAVKECMVDKVEFVADSIETDTYKVRRGDSLYTIARRHRTTVAVLRDLNDISAGRKLRIGMRLQVPERGTKKLVAKLSRTKKVISKPEDDQQSANEETEVTTADGKFYLVQPGDTLSEIADEYDSTVTELRRLNSLRRGSLLRVGMRLRVPAEDTGIPVAPDSDQVVPSRGPTTVIPIEHIIQPGESLTTIAKKYGVTIEALKKANNLKSRSLLKVGNRLLIPVKSSSQFAKTHGLQAKAAKLRIGKYSYKAKHQVTKSRIHIVKRGENLSHIADKYRVSVSEIRERNRIQQGSHLLIGARLFIPQAQARQANSQITE